MPRSQGSPQGKILQYFRSADLAEATLMLGLVKEAVGERTTRSAQAKARAVAVATPKVPKAPKAKPPKPTSTVAKKKKNAPLPLGME